MSFASDVKKEIAQVAVDECCFKAELYALIRLRSTISISLKNYKITFTTTSLNTSRRIVFLIKKLYGANVEILKKERVNLDQKPLYYLIIKEQGKEILTDLELLDENMFPTDELPKKLFVKECCQASFIRGAFLSKGSINDPTKNNYHLEITINNENDALFLISILAKLGIDAKKITRKKGEVIYIKKAEQIADLLRFIGAVNSLFNFEDLRIKKDLNNYVNRIINCDVANEQKALASANKQLENIEYLQKHHGFLNLTPRLMDAIVLRTTFPDDSLSELSEKSEDTVGRYISKSGLSHCFKDIDNLVIEYKKNKP